MGFFCFLTGGWGSFIFVTCPGSLYCIVPIDFPLPNLHHFDLQPRCNVHHYAAVGVAPSARTAAWARGFLRVRTAGWFGLCDADHGKARLDAVVDREENQHFNYGAFSGTGNSTVERVVAAYQTASLVSFFLFCSTLELTNTLLLLHIHTHTHTRTLCCLGKEPK